MDKKRLYEAVSEAVDEKELGSRDIPNIDLYVDQILNIFSSSAFVITFAKSFISNKISITRCLFFV